VVAATEVGANSDTAAAAARIWSILETVPDPEIPVLSVVDLGIVREVLDEDGCWTITITPTYSGCPAMKVIEAAIGAALSEAGLTPYRVATRLAPAWTTDWMSAAGRAKLHDFGIAPPAHNVVDVSGLSRRTSAAQVACPRCASSRTQVISQFGSTACKALYRCNDCLEPFDYFKCH
jgi:ring-1,2-phenylacetyl-CoA epoxidase subunit PaaD